MKALVIGATGIIGNHVIRSLLKDGIEVRALSRGITPALNLKGLDVEFVKADLNDSPSLAKAVKGCSWVFHTAPYYPSHAFNRAYHREQALKGLNSVINAVSQNSVDRFVYTSSLTTIGPPRKKGDLADERCPYVLQGSPPHPYFEVKYIMEEEVRRQALIGKLPAVIVNPTGCFGPYEMKPVELCLIPQLLNGKVPVILDHAINVVDVADVGYAHVQAARKGAMSYRYILGGHNVTMEWVIKTICKVAGIKPPSVKIPIGLALIPAWISEGVSHYLLKKPPFIPILGLRFLQHGQHYNMSKAVQDLEMKASPMEPCFEKAIQWYRSIGYCQ